MPPAVVMMAASCAAMTRSSAPRSMAAECCRASHLDQVGNAGAVILLDHAVEFDERPAEMLRQHAPERRFAGAAQADERDAPAALGVSGARDRASRSRWRAPAARLPALAPSRSMIAPSAAGRAPAFRQQRRGRTGRALARSRAARSPTDCRRRFRSAPDSAPRFQRLAPIAAASCRAWRDAAAPRRRCRREIRRRTPPHPAGGLRSCLIFLLCAGPKPGSHEL